MSMFKLKKKQKDYKARNLFVGGNRVVTDLKVESDFSITVMSIEINESIFKKTIFPGVYKDLRTDQVVKDKKYLKGTKEELQKRFVRKNDLLPLNECFEGEYWPKKMISEDDVHRLLKQLD